MTKPICIIQAPFATRSGYGDMSRGIIRQIIDMDLYDVKLVSTPWGATPLNALDGTSLEDQKLISRLVSVPMNLPRQPELFIQITIPNEFMRVAHYNIGITAGIETNMCSQSWLEGCNKMDLILATSDHSVRVLQETKVEQRNAEGTAINTIQVDKPVKVLSNWVNTDIFKKILPTEISPVVDDHFVQVKEKFVYLFVGHWLRGGMGEDRKNVGTLIKIFCDTFKNTPSDKRPALVLKTSGADFSIIDREEILSKIHIIRESCGPNAPNVYLLHGDLSEPEMNSLYNHPKVKVHVSFTKGEGFGRPLLEACMSEKPIVASGWSGHLDFLNANDAILLGGELKPVDNGAVWENIIIKESSWFNVDPQFAANALMHVFKKYDMFLPGAKKLALANAEAFGYASIFNKTKALLEAHVPSFAIPEEVTLKLPELRKLV